jgi:hypothetical protein
MRECVGGSGGAERMYAEAVHFGADTGLESILPNNIPIDRSRIERAVRARRCGYWSRDEGAGRRPQRRARQAPGRFRSTAAPSCARTNLTVFWELFKIEAEAIPPRLQLELVDAEGGRAPCAVPSRYSISTDSAFAIESLSAVKVRKAFFLLTPVWT